MQKETAVSEFGTFQCRKQHPAASGKRVLAIREVLHHTSCSPKEAEDFVDGHPMKMDSSIVRDLNKDLRDTDHKVHPFR